MKRIYKQIGYIALFAALSGCGKYGYDFKDGYQTGDSQGDDSGEENLNYVDRSMLDRARVYPGLVGDGVRRSTDTTITLNLNFRYVTKELLKVSSAPVPIFSTGLYAPAGENIKIVVPQGVLGLTVQLGAHMDDLSGKEAPRRDARIFTVKELFPGDNYVRNPYGGLIWIKPSVAITNPVNLKFTNAVRTSDFILGTTDQAAWLDDVAKNDVPWLELRSKRAIFTVPRTMVLQYRKELNIEKALKTWNEIYEKDYYTWMGLTENNSDLKNSWPDLPERGVLDIHPSAGYAHNGSPWVAQQDRHWFLQFSSSDYLLGVGSSGSDDRAWGAYHEIGHNYQMGSAWSWSALGETTNNIFIFRGAERLGIPSLAGHPSVPSSVAAALDFAASKNAKNFNTGEDRPFFRLTPFLQIFNKVKGKNGESGWDFWPFIYTKARNSNYAFSFDEAKMDFFYRTLCEFTGQDYMRFMLAWGIPVSSSARKAMREAYPPMATEVWTFNPLTKTGGNGVLPPKYDLVSSDFQWSSNMSVATNESIGFAGLSDGVLSTYFHTCYSGCAITTTATAAAPTYLDLDMKSPQTIRGVYLQNRQNGTYRRATNVWTKASTTAPWVKQGELILNGANTTLRNARNEYAFPTLLEVQFIRFEFNENNLVNEAHTAIAEAGVFYDPS